MQQAALTRWFVNGLIGVYVAVIAVLVALLIHYLSALKFKAVYACILLFRQRQTVLLLSNFITGRNNFITFETIILETTKLIEHGCLLISGSATLWNQQRVPITLPPLYGTADILIRKLLIAFYGLPNNIQSKAIIVTRKYI